MFNDKSLLVTGGTGSIGSSICDYFHKNGCKEIYSTTTNIKKIKPEQNYIEFKELDLNNIKKINLEQLFDFDTDYLISAIVLRLGGRDKIEPETLRILYSASEWCDYLESSEESEDMKQKGLGLHLYLKNKGFTLMKELCQKKGEITPEGRSTPSDETMTKYINPNLSANNLPQNSSSLIPQVLVCEHPNTQTLFIYILHYFI